VSAPLDTTELRALFLALNEGTISPTELEKLEGILTASAEARQLWFLHCDIETGLANWAEARRLKSLVIPFPPAERRSAKPVGKKLVPLAAAALALIAASWWLRERDGRQTANSHPVTVEPAASGVAVLSRTADVQWEDGIDRPARTVLVPDTLRLKSGSALIEFYSGARMVVEGPAELRLVSGGEAYLVSGKVNAHVPAQARGFSVESANLRVVDRGTDFGLAVTKDAAPEVHVFKGKVEVALAQSAPQSLNEGEAVKVEHGALQAMPAARAEFLTEDALNHRADELAAGRFVSWRQAARMLDANRAAVVHYTFEEAKREDQRVANQCQGAEPQTNGSVIGSGWTDGRWLGKRALEFRGEGDRIRFVMSAPQHAATFLAWVRVDSLGRWQNALATSDSDAPGAVHWHLTQRGELRLEIARNLGRSESDWEAVNSAPFVTAARFGQWLFLATTFDGKTIRHYGNGRLIGEGASFTPPALTLGAMDLGNWSGGKQRNFSGALDEFAVLSQAMTGEEIQALYEAGKLQ